VKASLTRLAEDIGLKYGTVNNVRWVASRWPKEHRVPGVSFTVYRILASIEDEGERFAAVKTPPVGKMSTVTQFGSGDDLVIRPV
jgi:hypothetical protein